MCGPFWMPSSRRTCYFVCFIENYSKKTWVYFMVHKDEVFNKFHLFGERLKPMLSYSSFLKKPSVWFWHFKVYVMIIWAWVWAMFFQNLNPSVLVLSHFFKSKNLWTWFLNRVRFHVHITHSLMLKIMWVQVFMEN